MGIKRTSMTILEKYDAVNQAASLVDLADVIRSFAGEDGKVQGRSKRFDAEDMASTCEHFTNAYHNVLTREFGIRQQAMMLSFYENLGS